MARSVLASEMATRVRYATGTVGDSHITNAELYLWLTAAVAATWDKLIASGLGGEGVKKATFNTVANQTDYPISTTSFSINGAAAAAGISDFWKVKTLYVNDGTGMYRPLTRVSPNEQYALKGPQSVIGMKLMYIPCAPTFSTGAESFDGINGWEEHAINLVAAMVKKKKEDDQGPFKAAAKEIEARMSTHANRNADEPPRVIRRRASQAWAARVTPYTGDVFAWDLRGDNIELYAASYGIYP
jgi:hypothetical protein